MRIAALSISLLCVVLAGCRDASNGTSEESRGVSLPSPGSVPGIGDPMPPLDVEGWISIDGANVGPDASDLNGRVVVIERWGFW